MNRLYENIKKTSLSFGLGGVAILIIGILIWVITGQFNVRVEAPLAIGVALIGLAVLTNPATVRQSVTGRQARYGSNAVIMSVAFLGIVSLLNFLGVRHAKRIDLTAEKQFSLSAQTTQVLADLKDPIHVTAFFPQTDSRRQNAEDLLKEYAARTDKFTYEFIDPDLQPALARQFQITSYGTLVFQRGDKTQDILGLQEQDFTSAIIKVSRETSPVVYFITGHQERDPESSEQSGYNQISSLLQKDNYVVKSLNLAVTDTVPSDAAVVVLAAPQLPLANEELQRLTDYADTGGKLLVMSDPKLPNPLGDLLNKYGVAFRNDAVIDPSSSFFGDVGSPLVSRYQFHQITKDMGGLTSFFPLARTLDLPADKPADVIVTPLIQTSPDSWGETDYENKQVRFDNGKDAKGPLTIAAVIEKGGSNAPANNGQTPSPKARLVVIGDSDFVSNGVLQSVRGAFGNTDLFLNAVNWLAEEETLISIRPKPPAQHSLILTRPQSNFIFVVTTILIPALVLLLGGVIWWRRR